MMHSKPAHALTVMKSKILVEYIVGDYILDVKERTEKKWRANRDADTELQIPRVDQTLGNMPQVAKLLT